MRKNLKRLGTTVIGLAVLAGIAYAGGVVYDLHRTYTMAGPTTSDTPSAEQIARGKYVAYTADCAACHTAKGGTPFAGGYPIDTPFGKILSSNITSDKQAGIGNWTLADFDRAVRHGKGSHGYLYPAMPYTAYARMSDGDIQDLWAYMHTVAADNHPVVENQLPFPYNQRWLLGGWNLLFFQASAFKNDPSKDAEYNRGAYLVEGPGHCAACHTGKNFLGGDTASFLQGASLGGWYAPDLTSNPHVGLGQWQVEDIAAYLKTGANDKAVSSGPMTEAIENSTQHLADADLHAIATYLKALPASPANAPQPLAATGDTMRLGKQLYESQCIACHVSNGSGIRRMIPALAGDPVINATNSATLLHMVLLGGDGPQTAGNPTGAGMPRFDWKLSDGDIAAIATYVRNSWGNAASPVTVADVHKARTQLGAKAWLGQ